jgi:RHS repeat-associated protein
VLSEYDGNNNLLRKYIYGPGIDQPVCMIEVADSNAVYYYHFDALGSVVALSDSAGDTVQTYEYSVYGQVAVEDINHPNPYMFAGRRFDIEIGLYYNRARYYNPFTGRFLQTDPIGYGAGMNLYAYCGNNSLNYADSMGLLRTLGPNEVPDAIFISDPDKTVWGLIGNWDMNDLYATYCADPGEILSARINGMTYYVEVDLNKNSGNKYVNDSNGEIVKLNNEYKPIATSIGNAIVENLEVAGGLDFSWKGWVGGVLYPIGLGLILTYSSSVVPGLGVAVLGASLFIWDTCDDPAKYVQIIAEAREPLEKMIERSEDGEFPVGYFCRWCQKYDCGILGHDPEIWQK